MGIAVLVIKDGKVLLGKRKGAHGTGEFASPGGHLEFWESIKACAKRECMEEAGIKIKNIKLVRVSNLKRYGNKHYLDVGLVAEWASGIPKVMEPKKCAGWEWYELKNPPMPLFGAIGQTLDALKTGKNFFDE